MQELTQGPMRGYFRGNLFANTRISDHPAEGGRPAFEMRFVLAATPRCMESTAASNSVRIPPFRGRRSISIRKNMSAKCGTGIARGNIKPLISTLNRIP